MEPRESRDEEFARLAAEYRQADADVIEAERQANQMAIALAAVRKDRDDLRKKLCGFVGANIRTRNAVVGGELVRVEYDEPTPVVSVEPVSLVPRSSVPLGAPA